MTYEEALAYIASLAPRGWRLGLDRMAEFARRAGITGNGPQFVHIAGTNGKGTVTAFVQSILVEHGFRTGAYFSPFVYDPRERIQFGREYISEEKLAELVARLIPVAEAFSDTTYGGISEFEFKTALGFLFWQEMGCEWVALEVGLGGRLDATNIITPKASVIASIGLDHTSVLGETLGEIAYEKAGVIKPGVPVVVGRLPVDACNVVKRVAADEGAPVWTLGREVVVSSDGQRIETPGAAYSNLSPTLRGAYVVENMALAIAAFEAAGLPLDQQAVERGVERAFLPGRFEKRALQGKTIILDGAHNEASAVALMETLRRDFPDLEVVLLTGMVQGHDPLGFYRPLAPCVRRAHCSPIDFHRALQAEELAGMLRKVIPETQAHASVVEAVDAALADVRADEILLVTGSFYLVGEVGKELSRRA